MWLSQDSLERSPDPAARQHSNDGLPPSRKRVREDGASEREVVFSKASREKLRRDRLNDRFQELARELGPSATVKVDKAVILTEAVRLLVHLRAEAASLLTSNQQLQDQIKELKVEKSELREEKSRLKAERDRLRMHLDTLAAPTRTNALARKRKSAADAATDVPRDLNEIPYIAWINKQIAAGRKPASPMPEEITSPRATSYEAPRDVPTCGRHDPDRVASSRVVDDNALDDDDGNSDYNEYAVGTDDEADSGEEPDKGMSDSEEDGEGDKSEDEDDAPEESLPAASNTRAGRAKPAAPAKTASKGGDPPRRAPKTRNHMPVKRSVWSLLESTIFVAARWFMEDELESLLGKQGSQYWARLINHLEKENPGTTQQDAPASTRHSWQSLRPANSRHLPLKAPMQRSTAMRVAL
ncbi:unnamed protein product [Closterium sp. NIES-64]|nr:unnamed protein product [Closterium sp. NIES-64]